MKKQHLIIGMNKNISVVCFLCGMETCHLNDYSVVGSCFSAKFSEKQIQIFLKPEKNILSFKIIYRFYFIHGCRNAHKRIVILYDYVSGDKKDVF